MKGIKKRETTHQYIHRLHLHARHSDFPYPPKYKSSKSETNSITQSILRYVSLHGGYGFRVNTQGQYDTSIGRYRKSGSTLGVSDIIICYRGRLIAVEVKQGRDKLSSNQEAFRSFIEAAGGIFFTCYSIDSFVSFFDQHVASYE